MIQLILEFFAELFVNIKLRKDDKKHIKKITAKENEDGKQRPLQKHLLKPSVTTAFIVITFFTILGLVFFNYQKYITHPKNTKIEIVKLSNRIEQWYSKYDSLPKTLYDIIGTSPVMQDWDKDAWHTPYRYTMINNNTSFLITSAGSDKEFNTEDDITSK
jgi:general secretion pathway protein G